MVKEYKVWEICDDASDTQIKLNDLAEAGWKLVCSYAQDNNWLIMERERK